LLLDAGYHTYIAGKWHLGSNVALRQTPDAWGFEHSYTLLGGATANHFGHEAAGSKNYVNDGQYVQPGQPGQPGGDGTAFYDTDFYTRKLIQWIDQGRADGKPFAAFATYTSPHWPLQVTDEYLNKYRGAYDAGYDVIRNRRLLRQKALGIVPANFTPSPGLPDTPTAAPATPNNGTANARYINALTYDDPSYVDHGAGRVNKKWSSLSANERKLQARYMEIYAGMVENLDHNIGLLIDHLKAIGEYDNTFIVFHSDNGAEGWPLSATTEALNLTNFDKLGRDFPGSVQNVQYGLRWAEVGATPHKLSKGFTSEGGTRVPTIVHLPGQTGPLPPLRDFAHITDAAPTLLALAGVAPPTTPAPPLYDLNGIDQNQGKVVYNSRYVYPISGLSLLAELEGRSAGPLHTQPVGEEQYGRAYLHDGEWKALWIEPPWGPADGHWQLYRSADQGEVNDVSAQYPLEVEALVQKWKDYLQSVGGVEPRRPVGYY
jgi:arylsulfatase